MTKIVIIFFQYSNLMFVLYDLLAHNLTLILCVEWTLNNVHIYMCNNNGWFVDSLIRSFFLFFLHWYLRRFCLSKDLWTLHFIERKNQFNVCMYVYIVLYDVPLEREHLDWLECTLLLNFFLWFFASLKW